MPIRDEARAQLLGFCDAVSRSMEEDVARFDGMELTGRTVAEIHAVLAATCQALARAIYMLVVEL